MEGKFEEDQSQGGKATILNTILFMVLGTILNLVLMIVLFVACFLLIAWLVPSDSPFAPIAALVGFVVSVGGSFFLYSLIVKKVSAKFHLESKMAPLFKRRKR